VIGEPAFGVVRVVEAAIVVGSQGFVGVVIVVVNPERPLLGTGVIVQVVFEVTSGWP
jgi:hypothetical protein